MLWMPHYAIFVLLVFKMHFAGPLLWLKQEVVHDDLQVCRMPDCRKKWKWLVQGGHRVASQTFCYYFCHLYKVKKIFSTVLLDFVASFCNYTFATAFSWLLLTRLPLTTFVLVHKLYWMCFGNVKHQQCLMENLAQASM